MLRQGFPISPEHDGPVSSSPRLALLSNEVPYWPLFIIQHVQAAGTSLTDLDLACLPFL